MDRVSFRYLVDDLLRGKSEEVKVKTKEKVKRMLDITKKGFMSEETVALIIVQVEDSLCDS